MTPDIFNTAMQLGIGGLSVAGIIYVSLKHSDTTSKVQAAFLKQLDERADKHEQAMHEREMALRKVEEDVRTNLVGALVSGTSAIRENTKLMERVMRHLDGVTR